jgi:single-strand DNA-binding protein
MSLTSTPITVVGKVVTEVTTRVIPSGVKVANFRLCSQERVYDKAQDLWADGDRMYMSIACWRRLADNVADTLRKGDQIVVHGRLKIDDYKADDGARRQDMRVDAWAVGPDLALHNVTINRPDWAISPDQQTLVNPTPVKPVPEEEPLAKEEVVQAA